MRTPITCLGLDVHTMVVSLADAGSRGSRREVRVWDDREHRRRGGEAGKEAGRQRERTDVLLRG